MDLGLYSEWQLVIIQWYGSCLLIFLLWSPLSAKKKFTKRLWKMCQLEAIRRCRHRKRQPISENAHAFYSRVVIWKTSATRRTPWRRLFNEGKKFSEKKRSREIRKISAPKHSCFFKTTRFKNNPVYFLVTRQVIFSALRRNVHLLALMRLYVVKYTYWVVSISINLVA